MRVHCPRNDFAFSESKDGQTLWFCSSPHFVLLCKLICPTFFSEAPIFQNGNNLFRLQGSIKLQAGRSRVREPMRWMNDVYDFAWLFRPHHVLGCTHLLTQNYERQNKKKSGEFIAAGVWGREPHRHLWAGCLENVGYSTSHNPTGLHGLLRR
jgi:hypothetical protein